MNRPRKEKTYLPEHGTDIVSKHMFALSKDIMDVILTEGAIDTPLGVLIIEGSLKRAPDAKLSREYGRVIYVDNSETDGYRFAIKYKPNWNGYVKSRYNKKRKTLKFKPYDVFKKKIFNAVKEGLWLNWYKNDRQ